MIYWRKVLLSITAIACLWTAMVASVARADVMYPTYTRDNFDNVIFTQPAYTPLRMLGNDLTMPDPEQSDLIVSSPLQGPKDVFVDSRDHIYIADTGNSRIVHYDENYDFVRYIQPQESPFSSPEGVFVDEQGYIYVADTGNRRVVILDPEGYPIREIGRPESRFIPKDFKYDPIKLVADRRGFLYVVTLGGYRGLLQLDPEGGFQSFFGANKTPFSVLDAMKRALYTREMYENEISKLPGAISNVAVGPDGFIYTATSGGDVSHSQVKRLNYEGRNLLVNSEESTSGKSGGSLTFGESLISAYSAEGEKVQTQIVDLTVDPYGNISVIDRQYNYVNQYDAYGNLLFFWGGRSSPTSTQLGLIKNPVAIDVNSRNELFVLDDQENVLQVFELSEFGKLVYQANELTNQGFYAESEPYWKQVLDLNAQFGPAIHGLAKAAYQRGDYETAKELFRRGGNQVGFSDAFWQLRLQWFQERFSLFATLFLVLCCFYLIGSRYLNRLPWSAKRKRDKKSRNKVVEQLSHALYMLKHPIDGFTALRFENKGGYVGAIVILLGMYVSLLVYRIYTSFVFNKIEENAISAVTIFIQFAVIWIVWVVCNYLISSIYRGEGRFRDVFIGSAYSLIPFVLFAIPLTIISNGMTLSEQAIYQYLFYGLIVWVGAMFFWQVQALQNYGVGETVVNILLSLFAMLVMAVLAFIIVGLTNELRMFIYEVYQEVTLR
ncbi:YIP1 family protein [Paenibacillus chungangensis]|uniref:YIP1 family protein n=1 Tax=Paenibacillus chungangensis TaxID=696535 RepID=A0ABW3HLT4_9BACL